MQVHTREDTCTRGLCSWHVHGAKLVSPCNCSCCGHAGDVVTPTTRTCTCTLAFISSVLNLIVGLQPPIVCRAVGCWDRATQWGLSPLGKSQGIPPFRSIGNVDIELAFWLACCKLLSKDDQSLSYFILSCCGKIKFLLLHKLFVWRDQWHFYFLFFHFVFS